MQKILISLLLIISLSTANISQGNSLEFNSIIYRNDIDLDSKSIKGWIRLFNSQQKINNYGYDIKEYERLLVLKELKRKYNNNMKKYKRGVE